jgi:putative Mn2+ efflux pump MntP
MKAIIVVTLLAIIASLGHALYSMTSGPTDSKRMVQALTVRISLSVMLFVLLMIGWYTGAIAPHAVGN